MLCDIDRRSSSWRMLAATPSSFGQRDGDVFIAPPARESTARDDAAVDLDAVGDTDTRCDDVGRLRGDS